MEMLIDCVTLDVKVGDAYHRVVRVGGPNLPGVPPPDSSRIAAELRRRGVAIFEPTRWTLSADEAIEGIRSGKWNFRVQVGVHHAMNVLVATSPAGRLYLKTEADEDVPHELLCLPQCR